ncbi:MAG: ACT domain-containing protein [Candidatus Cloacimonetes bacterium]|nr:ACT domain-containing protein [Candidatus Cloacimonadota bacterium]MDD3379435.1 ACT domain-containing protein [Candidatus Methanomethylophilaceae archaeon]
MSRTIITLVGKDHTGIIAAVCNYFAENNINILDISQTTVQEYINMMMIVDLSEYTKEFPILISDLDAVGKKVGCSIKAQHEEIFDMMHRI